MLATLLADILPTYGHRTAVTDNDRLLSYRELDRLSAESARDLAGVLPPVDRPRVGIQAGNRTGYVLVYLALLRAGCVPFLIDRASSPQETAAVIEDCGLDLLVHEEEQAVPAGTTRVTTVRQLMLSALPLPVLRPPLHGSTEVCRFTSGSSGRPRCIEFSGSAVHRASANWAAGTGLTADDRIACLASLSNGLAFNTSLLAAFLVGAQLHLGPGLPTAGRVLRMMDRTAATRLVAFPALYEALVRWQCDKAAFRSTRMAISSAAPLRPEIRSRFTALTGVQVQDYYGAAEAGPLTFAADPTTDPGLGQPLPGVVVRAGTPGAPAPIEVRSESMGTCYLNAPGVLESRTGPDGFYRTGDVGHLDGGSLVLTGRTTQHLNIAGRKIDAVEVADVLRHAPGVRDAVVLEVPDRHGTLTLGAVLVTEPSADLLGIRGRAADQLAPHKVPTLLRRVPEIPRGSTGKPMLVELRRLFEHPEAEL